MSRFFKVMIVLLTIAAFAAPAFATDLTISGQMRVEGYYDDVDSADDAQAYWDQRLRVQSVWSVSDDVKVVLRTDIGESEWGSTGQYSIRHPASNSGQYQIDKLYLQIDKEMFQLRAGEQYFGSPNAILVDNLGTGLVLTIKTPVSIKLNYTKYNENGSNYDDEIDVAAGGSYEYPVDANGDPILTSAPVWNPTAATTADVDDQDAYSVIVGYKGEGFSINGIYALLDNKANDDNRSAFGLAGTFNAGIVALTAELDIFDGDDGAGKDYVGTQLYVDANADVTEALNFGAWFKYVAGTDDADETTIIDITNWDSFAPHWGGYVGQTVLRGKIIAGWDGMACQAGNAGEIGGALYATFKASEDLSYKFMGQYSTEEESDVVVNYDYYSATASAKYKVATNTYLMADVVYEDIDGENADGDFDDNSIGLWTQLQVNF